MVARRARLEVRAISRVQGSDRKTPVDGVPAEPEIAETEGHGAASPPAGASDAPPLESSQSASPGSPAHADAPAAADEGRTEPSVPTPARSEAVTPQGATIATEDAPRPAKGQAPFWVRATQRLRFARGAGKAIAATGGIVALLGAIFLPRLFGQSEATPVPRTSAASAGGRDRRAREPGGRRPGAARERGRCRRGAGRVAPSTPVPSRGASGGSPTIRPW